MQGDQAYKQQATSNKQQANRVGWHWWANSSQQQACKQGDFRMTLFSWLWAI